MIIARRHILLLCITLCSALGCGGDDDGDDAGMNADAGPPDGGDGGATVIIDEPAFARAEQACPPAEKRNVAPARVTIHKVGRESGPPAGASASETGQFYLRRLYPHPLATPAQLRAVHDRGGAVVLDYRQTVDGIDVFRKELNLVLTRDRQLIAVSGKLSASPVAAQAGPRRRTSGDVDARRAIAAAARDLGVVVGPDELVRTRARPRHVEFRAPGSPALAVARVRPTYFDDGTSLVPAQHVELMGSLGGPGLQLKSAVVGAGGAILFRNDKTVRAEPFGYRVYAEAESLTPSISPFCEQLVPHPSGEPDGQVPAEPCSQELVSLIHAGSPTADPWLADAAVETSGNNVDAFFHIQTGADGNFHPPDFTPANGDFRAQTTTLRVFDYPYDPAAAPDDYFEDDTAAPPDPADPQLNAKIAHGFYLGNYLHDLMYRHGYDEASGNSQADNYGRGGAAGDPLLVHAGSFTTFTLPTPDGTPPVLTMGLNNGSQLNRDATLDLMVFGHEWMHTMQHRLIGDSEGLSTPQARALAEGWADFFGLLIATRPEQAEVPANADWTAPFALGPYFNMAYCDGFPPPLGVSCDGPDQAYYFGIRRYPFTTDKSKSPLTFRHIANGLALPDGIPVRFWNLRIENAEEHSAGEIWASALWGCYRALLVDERYTFAEARDRMLDYLVASMKATPIEPTFLEARDALLAVARAEDAGDYQAFRQAFADRGMGAGALAPPRDSRDFREVVESLRAEGPALSFVAASLEDGADGDRDGLLDAGEKGTLTLVLRNTGFEDLSDTTVRAAAVGPEAVVTGGDEVFSSDPGEDIVAEFSVALGEADHHQLVEFDVAFGDASTELATNRMRVAFHVHYDLAHTETLDAADDPITQIDWHSAPDLPWSETVWTRVEQGVGEDHAYQVDGARIDGGAALVSPCVLASAGEDLILRFEHAYRPDVFGAVEVRTAGSSEFDWQQVYVAPGDSSSGEPAEVNLGQAYEGQWLQVRFWASVPPAAGDDVPTWTVDDIEFAGIDNTPFAAILPDGSAPRMRTPRR